MRRGLLLLCVVAISGCDCGTPVTPDGGVDAGPVSMDAGSDAGVLDAGVVELGITLDEPFGAVLRGSSVQRQGHVTNLGARPVVVSGFSVGDAAFTLMAPTTTMLQPQGSLDFAVRFTAGAHGLVTSSLDFVADGAPQHFALSAESIGPLARVMPTSLDLGQVPLYGGTTATETAELAVENLGRDTMVHEPGTDLQVTFDVAQLDGDPATVCVNDCLPEALRVPVAMAVTTTLRVDARPAPLRGARLHQRPHAAAAHPRGALRRGDAAAVSIPDHARRLRSAQRGRSASARGAARERGHRGV